MRGTYTIVLDCKGPIEVRFGKRGHARLAKGYYLYTGSGLGRGAVSLEGRITRHGGRSKKIRWHVDYLTTRRECIPIAAVYAISRRRLECVINRLICDNLQATTILERLGASDCKCKGHLVKVGLRVNQADLLEQLSRLYSSFGPSSVILIGAESRLSVPLPIASGKHPGKS